MRTEQSVRIYSWVEWTALAGREPPGEKALRVGRRGRNSERASVGFVQV